MRLKAFWLGVSCCLNLAAGSRATENSPQQMKGLGYVVVSPEGPRDGGDFGPLTPGTKTAGIREAIDFAKEHRRDVYLVGGAMPKAFEGGAVYHLQETLRIPWMQDFKFEGGEAVINYDRPTGDAVVMDSQMSCRYKFGLIVCPSDGAALRLKPETKGPDNFSVITTTVLEINALVGGGSVFPGEGVRGQGVGLWFDGGSGSIDSNRISVTEILSCDKGIFLEHGTNNYISVADLHLCNTHLEIGKEGGTDARFNRIETTIASQGIKGSLGVVLHGQSNLITAHFVQSSRDVVFEKSARDNVIRALSLRKGYTNNAEIPTNRILITPGLGFSLETPPLPESGQVLINRFPFTVDVLIVSPGEVTSWKLIDAAGNPQEIHSALGAGQIFRLVPGDGIGLEYRTAPQWKWKGLSE